MFGRPRLLRLLALAASSSRLTASRSFAFLSSFFLLISLSPPPPAHRPPRPSLLFLFFVLFYNIVKRSTVDISCGTGTSGVLNKQPRRFHNHNLRR